MQKNRINAKEREEKMHANVNDRYRSRAVIYLFLIGEVTSMHTPIDVSTPSADNHRTSKP